MSGWTPAIWLLDRSGSRVRVVVQTGRQTNCGGIARITVRGERGDAVCTVIDACTRQATAPYRESAIHALRERLRREQGLRAIIEDDYEHPVDLNRAKFVDAGYIAAAFLSAWLRTPHAPDAELVDAAWEEEACRCRDR